LDENRKKEDNLFEIHAKSNARSKKHDRIDEDATPRQAGFHWTKIIVYRRKKA
jgi:hypothetical protein